MKKGMAMNFWFGMAAMAASILFFACIRLYVSDASFTGVSGRAFPYVIDAFLGILGAGQVISALRGACHEKEAPPLGRLQIRDLAIWLGMMCLYGLGITWIGFLISTYIVLFATLWFLGLRKPLPLISMTLIVPPLLWWLFHKVVEVQFPDALLI